MSTRAVINAIVDDLTTNVTILRDVYVHAGIVDINVIQKYARRAPSAAVTYFSTTDMENSEEPIVKTEFGIYLIIPDSIGKSSRVTERRELYQLDLMDAVINRVSRNDWGVTCSGIPQGLRARNQYTELVDAMGVNVIEIVWNQQVILSRVATGLEDLLSLFIEYKQTEPIGPDPDDAAAIGATDIIDFTTLGEGFDSGFSSGFN